MFIEKDLFVAVLNTIYYIDELGFTKQKAIKMFYKPKKVTQKSIKETLDAIGYITPNQSKKKYNTNGYYESKRLLNAMSK
jgi:hypothetical protein